MGEHTILVAFTVEAPTRAEAQEQVMFELHAVDTDNGITSWWIAEDDRLDRSDCDSAVFVRPGAQHSASVLLHNASLTAECNLIPRRRPILNWEEAET